MKAALIVVGAIFLPLALICSLLLFVGSSANACGTSPATVDASKLPDSAAGYDHAQLVQAAAIANAGTAHSAPAGAQTIAIMVAITETKLRKPLADVDSFYTQLLASPGWQSKEPSIAANLVRGNPDPYFYAAAYPDAQKIMTVFGVGGGTCVAGPPGVVNAQGWAIPAAGHIINGYGLRPVICTPVGCSSPFHRGDDISGPGALNRPIYAAATGTVIQAGPNGTYGNSIMIDHGNGIVTLYGHMYSYGILVTVGEQVAAGQNIAKIGCAGVCTGPHLHFEVRINGTQVDPVPFMTTKGIRLE